MTEPPSTQDVIPVGTSMAVGAWPWLLVGALFLVVLVLLILAGRRWYPKVFSPASLPTIVGVGLAIALCHGDILNILTVLQQGAGRYALPLFSAITSVQTEPEGPSDFGFGGTTKQGPSAPTLAFQWVSYLGRNLPLVAFLRIFLTLPLMVILARLTFSVSAEGVAPGPLLLGYGRLHEDARQAIVVLGLFLISIYLCLASLVAFPWFRDEPVPKEFNASALQAVLDSVAVSREQQTAVPAVLPESSGAIQEVEQLAAGLGPDTSSDSLRKFCQGERARMVELRGQVIGRWEDLWREVREERRRVLRRAVQEYDISIQFHMTSQERAVFFRRVVDWHRVQVRALDARLANAKGVVRILDYRLAQWTTFIKGVVQNPEELGAAKIPLEVLVANAWVTWGPGGWLVINERAFDLTLGVDERVRPPEPGSDFGPFGVVASWLLRTRSQALAVLTGMLGFGMFGAMIGRFVRVEGLKGRHTGEWTMTVLRGFSAAVVVFLAVQGGINVFSTGEREPNPYSLCLACLVGAVFSEQVWKWARDKLSLGATPPSKDKPPA